MNQQQMKEILFELRKELAEDEDINSHHHQVMESLAQEIEARVFDPQTDLSGDQFLLTRLKEAAEEFETEHPKLTAIVGRLSDLLARMGI